MVSVGQGWEGYVRIKLENNSDNWSVNGTIYAIDPYLTTITLDSSVDMEKIYCIGTRTAVDTAEGIIDLTGSIEKPMFENETTNQIIWCGSNNATWYSLTDVSGYWGTNVSKCAILLMPSGLGNNLTYVLHDVKFHDYSISLGAQEITMETVSFTADNASTS